MPSGVIFSITLVALQLANQQFSPNIVRKFEGSGTVKFAMGLFIATFIYALLLLRESSATSDENTQLASATMALLLVIASVVIFVITELLLQIARRPAPSGYYADSTGQIRLQQPLRSWDEYVDLAFNDIRHYGANHPLVQRKLVEAFDRLLQNVPESRKPPVEQQCELLNEAGQPVSRTANQLISRSVGQLTAELLTR